MTTTDPREAKLWWAVTYRGDVREVTGYSCGPTNPLVWWCPDLGFSGTQGYHLFTCESAALTRAIIELEAEIKMKSKQLDLLKMRLSNVLDERAGDTKP